MNFLCLFILFGCLFSILTGYETCMRKSALYHDDSLSYHNDVIDKTASLPYKYLKMSAKRETSRLLSCFNWTDIVHDIKKEFVKICDQNGTFMYNYTVNISLTINNEPAFTTESPYYYSDYSTSYYNNSYYTTPEEEENPNVKTLISKILGLNETSIQKCLNNTNVGTTNFLELTHCNNVSVTDVYFNIDNESAAIYLKGVSASGTYSSSSSVISCLESIINVTKKVNYFINATSNCDNCNIVLMQNTVNISEKFKNTLKKIGLENNNATNSFYRCKLTGTHNTCEDVLQLDYIVSNITVKNILKKQVSARRKRSINASFNKNNLDCVYSFYGVSNIEEACFSHQRTKRSDDKKHQEVPSIKKGMLGYAKHDLRLREVIPQTATHLQVGARGAEGGVFGDKEIYDAVKSKAGLLTEKIVGRVPQTLTPSQLYSEISKRPVLPPGVQATPFTEALKLTADLKKQSLSSVYASLTLSGSSGSYIPPRYTTEYATLTFKSGSFVHDDYDSDFEDINQVVKEYNRLRAESRGSESDFEDVEKVKEEYEKRYGKLTKESEQKTKEPIYAAVKKTRGDTEVIAAKSKFNAPFPNVDTSSVVVAPSLSRQGAVRRIKRPENNVPPPLPPKPNFDAPPLPPRPDNIPPPLPPRQEAKAPTKQSKFPFGLLKRCKRSTPGVVCGMIQSRPVTGQGVYSLLQQPQRVYEEIGLGGIPRPKIPQHTKTKYSSDMLSLSQKFDKSMLFGTAMMITGQQAIQQQHRLNVLQGKNKMSEEERIFEAVSMSLSTVGSSLAAGGLVGGTSLMMAGMGITTITGIIDAVKDIYRLFSGEERPVDPVIKLFNTYSGLVSDNEKMGVRKCLVPGEDTIVFMAYKNSSNFKPNIDSLAIYFLDVINSELLYLNTSNLVLEYQLRVACPIGTLRSIDTDITAYTVLYDESNNVKKYKFTRLATLLSRHPVLRLTCGLDTTLTIRPYSVPIYEMQLLKMATPGEPEYTKSIPSDTCDKYPLKKFYLLAGGCPYDTSQTFIVHTTCSILLKTSTWDPFKHRWVLQNPFKQEGTYKQLFTFSKYDFNTTIIDPNGIQGHASFCTNRYSNQCFWSEPMILEDVTSCQSRSRKLYVKIGLFGGQGFSSFVLTCPSGSTPMYIEHDDNKQSKNKIIELPVGDYGVSKMYASTLQTKIGVFCVHNYDKRYKSDIIVIMFEKVMMPFSSIYTEASSGKNLMFNKLSFGMPLRSLYCDNRRPGCYLGNVKFQEPIVEMDVNYGNEIMLRETYDANSVDPYVLNKSINNFPSPLNVTFIADKIGNAYNNPSSFWQDAKNKKRTYSAMLIKIVPCTVRNKNINMGVYISNMVYVQSLELKYGDGKKYYFRSLEEDKANCTATLDLTSRQVNVQCPSFSIPRRNVSEYEGLCFIVVTSKDHCATETEWMKTHGYGKRDAINGRSCYNHWYYVKSLDHYCSYQSTSKIYYPDYDACKSYIHVEYRDVWIESEVLMNPPYSFEFIHDESNEYINKDLSDKLNELYDEYKKIVEYTDGSLPASINRLAKALTKEGREIAKVSINSELLDAAYQADQEKLIEIQEKIQEITKDIFIHTLSDNDIKDIIESEENQRCCILDVRNNRVEKYYPIDNYICGNVSDYTYVNDKGIKYVLVNESYVRYDYLYSSSVVVTTCYNMTIIPIDTDKSKSAVEETLLINAITDAINDLFEEIDANVSVIIVNERISYLRRKYYLNNVVYPLIAVVIISILTLVIIYVIYKKIRHRKYILRYYKNKSCLKKSRSDLVLLKIDGVSQ